MMAESRLVITVDLDIPDSNFSSSSNDLLAVERRSQIKGMISRGLKRTEKAFRCLQGQDKLVDQRVFSLDMDFNDIHFAIEHRMDGNWNRSSVVFRKTFEGDGYEIT